LTNNQIEKIKNFFSTNDHNLLVNQVNEEIGEFYVGVIRYFAQQQSIKLTLEDSDALKSFSHNLFQDVSINLFYVTQTKKVEQILKSHEKNIIITDYKNWKRYTNSFQSINGYSFEKDLKFLMSNVFNISNEEIYKFCRLSPALAFSEIYKYLINNKNYVSDLCITPNMNYIIDIRKRIFDEKREDKNLQKIFQAIKSEVKIKKFSFLTF